MKKAATISYYLLLMMGALLVLLANVSASTETYEKYVGDAGTEIYAKNETQLSDDIREYTLTGQSLRGNSCLLFFTNHQCIRVYADDVLVYAVMENSTILGKTPGAYWNFVTIPEDTAEIRVQVEAVYPQVRGDEISFLTGEQKAMYQKMIQSSVLETLVSVIDILIGMIMLVYWGISKKRGREERSTLFFSLFAILLGLWSLNETTFVRLVVPNRAAGAFGAYVFLMLMTIPYLHFIEEFLKVRKGVWQNLLSLFYSGTIFVLSILHFTGIREFKQTLFVVHIMLVIEFVYSIALVLVRMKRRGADLKVKITLVGIFGFFCAFVADMFAYYVGMENTDLLGRISLLVYILLMGYDVLVEALKHAEEWQKAKVYRELAMKDTLTGLYNRNAYNQWLEEHSRDQDVAILMCDLNDLKKCNDTRGHAVGDSYIMGAADIISTVFGQDGDCYRIGGDEFCVILKDGANVDIPEKIRQLNEMEKESNEMLVEMKINIAYGYAIFDKEQDMNIEDTCKRADQEMYRNKKERKLLAV